MIDKIRKVLDITFWKFILVGIANTLFGTAIMFIFYNVCHMSYWISSASNYVFGSILSYFLNKHFTFQNRNKDKKVVVRFIINITCCYLVAYGAARPIVRLILGGFGKKVQDNCAMLTGMFVLVLLNYIGQRLWAIKEK